MSAYIAYGTNLKQFKDIDITINTLFKFVLGELGDDFIAMRKMNLGFTISHFMIFMIAMQFILLNMFVAFIASSYSYVNRNNKTTLSKEQLLL